MTGAGVAGTAGAGVAGSMAGAATAAGFAAAWTSSRVMMPSGPDGTTVARSTPRSLASLRTGGLARGRSRTAGAPPWPFSSAWMVSGTCGTVISGPLRGRRLVEDAATP